MFFVVRHGNTFQADTKPRRIGARTDLPLTARGIEQARALGRYFSAEEVAFQRVLVSPLARTRQTASEILHYQDAPPQPVHAGFLREIDYGPDENQLEETVLDRIGSEALEAWDKRAEIPPGWIVDPGDRIAAWRELFRTNRKDSATLLVTSNGAARFAIMADPSLMFEAAALASLKLPTGGFGVIASRDDGNLSLQSWGERP